MSTWNRAIATGLKEGEGAMGEGGGGEAHALTH